MDMMNEVVRLDALPPDVQAVVRAAMAATETTIRAESPTTIRAESPTTIKTENPTTIRASPTRIRHSRLAKCGAIGARLHARFPCQETRSLLGRFTESAPGIDVLRALDEVTAHLQSCGVALNAGHDRCGIARLFVMPELGSGAWREKYPIDPSRPRGIRDQFDKLMRDIDVLREIAAQLVAEGGAPDRQGKLGARIDAHFARLRADAVKSERAAALAAKYAGCKTYRAGGVQLFPPTIDGPIFEESVEQYGLTEHLAMQAWEHFRNLYDQLNVGRVFGWGSLGRFLASERRYLYINGREETRLVTDAYACFLGAMANATDDGETSPNERAGGEYSNLMR